MKKVFTILTLFGFSAVAFADELTETAPETPSFWSQWQMPIMLGAGFLLIYMLIMRPEKKRRRAAEERRSTMKKGDRVTAVGIIGTVNRVLDDTVIISLHDGAKMEVLKGAVSEVRPGSEEPVTSAS